MALTSHPKTRKSFLPSFNACIRAPSMPVTGSAWRFARRLSNSKAAESGWNLKPNMAPPSSSPGPHCCTARKKKKHMKATTEVLLVDDNPGDTDLTADVLSKNDCPCHVHSVPDGAEAMAFLRCEGKYAGALPPHLIMLDLNMPRKDGLTMLAETKSDPSLRKIPVVIFSASRARADIARSY